VQFHALNLTTDERRTVVRSRSATRRSTPTAASPMTPDLRPGTGAGSANGWSRSTRYGRTTGPAWCSTATCRAPGRRRLRGFWLAGRLRRVPRLGHRLRRADAEDRHPLQHRPEWRLRAVWQSGAAPSVASNGDLIFCDWQRHVRRLHTTTPPGPAAQGEAGFGLGYAGIGQSVASPSLPPSEHRRQLRRACSSTASTHRRPLAPSVYQPLRGPASIHGGVRGPQRPAHLPGDPLV